MALVLALLVSVTLVSAAPGATWNELVNSDGLFPSPINSIKSSLNDQPGVLAELKTILNDPQSLSSLYENFLTKYGSFDDNEAEVASRLVILRSSIENAVRHNLEARRGEHSWVQGVNFFADKTREEKLRFTGALTQSNATTAPTTSTTAAPRSQGRTRVTRWQAGPIPDSWDSRAIGIVTPPKDQGGCGSCTLFAAVSVMETASLSKDLQMGVMVEWLGKYDYSEQELLDCAQSPNDRYSTNRGCGGNRMDVVMKYIKNGGITSEWDYPPYESIQRTCRRTASVKRKAKTITFLQANPQGNEEQMKETVFRFGSVLTRYYVGDDFFAYHDGIYDGKCKEYVGSSHAVAVVGYGKENGKDFWLVKNSWGQDWGEKGFFRMRRNANNLCGIATETYYIRRSTHTIDKTAIPASVLPALGLDKTDVI